jgi:hypothetical protein
VMSQLAEKLKDLAPYVLIALLPGGSLLAVVCWFVRRDKGLSVLADLMN